MNIGWPEGLLLALYFLSLTVHAAKHGQPRDNYNFPLTLVGFAIIMLLLWQGEFFA